MLTEILRAAPDGRHCAFEPLPDLYRDLRPLVVFEHALGGSDFYGTTPEVVHDFLVGSCGLRISLLESWLDGRPPLSREGLAEQFHSGANFYFLAHP